MAEVPQSRIKKLRFPFLDIEFKSQAKNGAHYVATSQVAGAGAIALNSNMDLIRGNFGAGSFDYEETRFFPVTMDHQLACVNVHWLKVPAGGGGQGEDYCRMILEEKAAHHTRKKTGLADPQMSQSSLCRLIDDHGERRQRFAEKCEVRSTPP